MSILIIARGTSKTFELHYGFQGLLCSEPTDISSFATLNPSGNSGAVLILKQEGLADEQLHCHWLWLKSVTPAAKAFMS